MSLVKQVSLGEGEVARSKDEVSLEGTEEGVIRLGKHAFQSCSQHAPPLHVK